MLYIIPGTVPYKTKTSTDRAGAVAGLTGRGGPPCRYDECRTMLANAVRVRVTVLWTLARNVMAPFRTLAA